MARAPARGRGHPRLYPGQEDHSRRPRGLCCAADGSGQNLTRFVDRRSRRRGLSTWGSTGAGGSGRAHELGRSSRFRLARRGRAEPSCRAEPLGPFLASFLMRSTLHALSRPFTKPFGSGDPGEGSTRRGRAGHQNKPRRAARSAAEGPVRDSMKVPSRWRCSPRCSRRVAAPTTPPLSRRPPRRTATLVRGRREGLPRRGRIRRRGQPRRHPAEVNRLREGRRRSGVALRGLLAEAATRAAFASSPPTRRRGQ